MEWTDETIARLRALWAEGHSTAEIGRRLGISKNAVVGKAHRLDLAARPSPIRPSPEGSRPRPAARRSTGPTLPPLASTRPVTLAGTAPSAARPPGATAAPRSLGALALRAPAPQPAPAPRLAAVAPRPYGRVITCCWPIGEPGTRSFRFCDAESVPGKPYCAEHAELAYVKVRDRREDAA
jgi:GcrA cell cycle regulator